MTDTMLPLIREMHDAADDRDRAGILLILPDAVLMKHREIFEAACHRARFEAGLQFIAARHAAWHQKRLDDGTLPDGPLDTMRAALAAFAYGRPC